MERTLIGDLRSHIDETSFNKRLVACFTGPEENPISGAS